MKKTLHIFYIHYNIEGSDRKNRPQWFDYEKCLKNLLETIEGREDVKLYIMMDGDKNNFISNYNLTTYYELHNSGRNNFLRSWEYAKSIALKENSEKDLFYFLENDYLHVQGWVDKVFELFDTYSNLNYISLYDHNDKYFLPMYDNLTSKIFTTPTHHWRTTPSTCGTHIVDRKTFLEDYDIPFQIVGDHNKWLWLNQNKSRSVLTPIPGLSTHCMEGLMSPTINWETI
tara:strand:+ start:10830 stop:11516 length:687 start_codon:yes stop_codon:yes gene_type:complete